MRCARFRARWTSPWPTRSSRSRSAEQEGGHFYRGNPSLWSGEAIFSVIGLVTRDFAPLPDRLAAATARMAAIPRFLGGRPADDHVGAGRMARQGAPRM